MPDLIFTEREAAAYLRIKPEDLKVLWMEGRGPRYLKMDDDFQVIRFRYSDLVEYLDGRCVERGISLQDQLIDRSIT